MALPIHAQVKYWGVASAAFVVLLWLLGDVILPFILGGAIAYLLDPVADWLQRRGFSRVWATVVITFLTVLSFVVLALLVIPMLANQAVALANAAPQIVQNLQAFLTDRFPSVIDEDSILRRSLDDLGETVRSRGAELVRGVLSSVGTFFSGLIVLVIVPVVAFYLLMDWDRLVARIDALLPREHAPTIRRLAREIDDTLAGFVRGQGTVCLILGTYYAVTLMLVGLPFGLVVGFIAGLLTFIPYVGAIVGGVLSIGLALFQFWGDWIWIALVWAIFQSGQFVEGNILTPKLVGDSVGLHPVWLIFALSAFGALFGFVGLLVAVPVAAVLGVLTRFGVEQYRHSTLYSGIGDGGPD